MNAEVVDPEVVIDIDIPEIGSRAEVIVDFKVIAVNGAWFSIISGDLEVIATVKPIGAFNADVIGAFY